MPTEERHIARVGILDASNRVRFLRMPDVELSGEGWELPGGGLKGDETHMEAAVRVSRAEVGINQLTVGPWVWTRRHASPGNSRGRVWVGQDSVAPYCEALTLPPFARRSTVTALQAVADSDRPRKLPTLRARVRARALPWSRTGV